MNMTISQARAPNLADDDGACHMPILILHLVRAAQLALHLQDRLVHARRLDHLGRHARQPCQVQLVHAAVVAAAAATRAAGVSAVGSFLLACICRVRVAQCTGTAHILTLH